MFENVAVEELLRTLSAHDFDGSGDRNGAEDVDGIRAYELLIRAAQAGQTRLIGVLDAKRGEKMTLGRGDHALSVTISIDSQAALERVEVNRANSFVSIFPEQDGVAVLQVRGPAELMVAAFSALDRNAASRLQPVL